MSDNVPSHYGSEKQKGTIIIMVGVFTSIFLFIHLIQLAPVLSYIITTDFNKDSWSVISLAFSNFYSMSSFTSGVKYNYSIDQTLIIILLFVFTILSVIPAVLALVLNPYRLYDLIHGDAKNGSIKDIREMETRGQIGIKGGKYLHLGLWPKSGESLRMIETLSALVLAPPGTGKCLSPKEPVLMYNGTIKLTGDLIPGDKLMGPDGTPRTVISTNSGYGPMYRVIPKKGKSYECNGYHILSLRSQNKSNPLITIDVNEWLNWSDKEKNKWKQWRTGVDFPEIENPIIDPYFMGILLMSGSYEKEIIIQTKKYEIRDAIYEMSQKYKLMFKAVKNKNNDLTSYYISEKNISNNNPLLKDIHSEGLNNLNKNIPHKYKVGSNKTRLSILAGIIDTKANYNENENTFNIICSNKYILNDIAFIAKSLGFSAYIYDRDNLNEGYEIIISGNIFNIPTKIKYNIKSNNEINENIEYIDFDIVAIGDGEYFGIILDGDRLYLLDDFTVTHNTASFVVPSIIDTPESSFIVNDPKPELFDLTSGYRSEIGNVYMINWSATDKVDPTNLDDPTKTIFYPRFNVLSPELLPPAGSAERDTYLDAIANVMSPSNSKGGSSDYFEQKGRAALVGFLHYICSKICDQTEETRSLKNIPDKYHNEEIEASIPMLIDLINEGLITASNKNDEDKKAAAENQQIHQGDAMSDWLKDIVKECVEKEYNPRAITEITPLISMAPNERSGILGTMDKAFLPFKNAAVRERTSSCDFVPADLRGQPDENGIMRPVTLYVCVNQAEASAFATITSLLYEVLSREYLAYGPGEVNRNNIKLGPYPVCFMLDEFAKLPRIEAVMTGPDLGRSKKTMYCLVAQSDAQIGKLYSKEDQQIIYATTAVKYILPQNDKDTIKLVQEMVGPTTIRRRSNSKTRGGDFKEWGKSNESTSIEKVDFIRSGDISGMKPGTHIIIAQGYMNRPYMMKSVLFFKDPIMLSKVYNPRTGLGPKPAYPVPEKIRQKRIKEWRRKEHNKSHQGDQERIVLDLTKYEDIPEPITK